MLYWCMHVLILVYILTDVVRRKHLGLFYESGYKSIFVYTKLYKKVDFTFMKLLLWAFFYITIS